MDDLSQDKEFIYEQVDEALKHAIDTSLNIKDQASEAAVLYNKEKVTGWCGQIAELCIKNLSKLNKPFKYVVTVVIHQNVGAGIQSATCAYFDTGTDGVVVCQREFPDMLIIASVFAMVI